MDKQRYVIFLFPSMNHVLKAEKILKGAGIIHKLIPVPRNLSTDCGVCLRIAVDQRDAVAKTLQDKVTWEREESLPTTESRFSIA